MNKRARGVLNQLIEKYECGQSLTIKNLTEIFNVSSRTIRYDIDGINDFLREHNLNPISFGKKGLVITADDIVDAKELLQEEGFYSFKLSKEERKIFAVVLLLCADDYITLAEIADNLFVSRSTVIQDLDLIKDYFRENQLYLFSHSNKGLLLEGRESDKRRLLVDITKLNTNIFKALPVYNHLISCIAGQKNPDLETQMILEKILNESEHAYGRFFTDQSFVHLRMYLEISLCRLRQGHYVETSEKKNSKYDMAKGIAEQMERYLVNEIPESEILFLGKVLNHMKYIKKTTSNHEIVKMQVITRTFIENISQDLGQNLQGDYIFYENLINHLESTFSMVGGFTGINSVVEEVVQRYPKVLEATKKNVSIFEEYIGREFSEEEIAYVVVHICAAIERNQNEKARYSVILVCNGGIGTSQLLLTRLEKFFHLNVLDIIPAHDINSVDLSNVDVVISTVALKNAPIEYIQVEPLLTDNDCIRVGEKLSKITPKEGLQEGAHKKPDEGKTLRKIKNIVDNEVNDKIAVQKIEEILDDYFGEKTEIKLSNLLPEEAIALGITADSWEDAIRTSAQYLLKNGFIEERYIDAMISNVRTNGPYIVLAPGFALPHEALDAGANKVGMSMIQLSHPIPFGKEGMDPIEWVCCLSAINKEKHLKAMFQLVNLFNNKEFREQLNKLNTEKEVFQLIRQYES